MKTAKQVWEGYRVAYKKRFTNWPRITIDEVNDFKEKFLQSALDEAWEAGMREAAEMTQNNNWGYDGDCGLLQAILTRIKEREK